LAITQSYEKQSIEKIQLHNVSTLVLLFYVTALQNRSDCLVLQKRWPNADRRLWASGPDW